jgi:hypothetical protein
MGLDTKTYWLTDRQSQCDFDLKRLHRNTDPSLVNEATPFRNTYMSRRKQKPYHWSHEDWSRETLCCWKPAAIWPTDVDKTATAWQWHKPDLWPQMGLIPWLTGRLTIGHNATLTWKRPRIFIRDKPILSYERMLHTDYDRKGSVGKNKTSGHDPQET